jgi:hypothetical protein
MTKLVDLLAAILTTVMLALSADLFRKAGLSLYTEQYLAGLMALAMPILFLSVPARGPRKRTAAP